MTTSPELQAELKCRCCDKTCNCEYGCYHPHNAGESQETPTAEEICESLSRVEVAVLKAHLKLTQSQLTAAKAENERLCGEIESWKAQVHHDQREVLLLKAENQRLRNPMIDGSTMLAAMQNIPILEDWLNSCPDERMFMQQMALAAEQALASVSDSPSTDVK